MKSAVPKLKPIEKALAVDKAAVKRELYIGPWVRSNLEWNTGMQEVRNTGKTEYVLVCY